MAMKSSPDWMFVDALAGEFEAVFRTEPAEHWVGVLRAAGVPVGPINQVDEAFELASDLGMEPSRDGLITPPLRIDGSRPPIRHRPPHLDEHGDDLRAWLAT